MNGVGGAGVSICHLFLLPDGEKKWVASARSDVPLESGSTRQPPPRRFDIRKP